MLDFHELYSEMGQRALTDYDEVNYHNNEIISIIESKDTQVYYQIDKDWRYRQNFSEYSHSKKVLIDQFY